MEWIPVDEALPLLRSEPGQLAWARSDDVLVWLRHPTPSKRRFRVAYYSWAHARFLPPHPGEFAHPITHWMPIDDPEEP